jgi:hypothetical protein
MHRNRLITGFLVLTLSIVSASTAWAVGAGETEILDKLIRVRTNQIILSEGARAAWLTAGLWCRRHPGPPVRPR